MSSLALLQSEFLSSINSTTSNQFFEHIQDGKNLSLQARINIYRSSTHETLVKTLQYIYPICQAILGGKYFGQLCRQYVKKKPSQHWDLNLYGNHFPVYLSEHTAGLPGHNKLPYLSDLAKLEQYFHAAYYAADNNDFPHHAFNQLSAIEQTNSRFILAGNVQFMSSRWPIYTFWASWQQGSLPDRITAIDNPQYLCIYRSQYQPTVELVDASLFQLIKLINNYTLAELTQLAESNNDLRHALPHIAGCIEKGWINHFLGPEVNSV